LTDGLSARLRSPLTQRADLSQILVGDWTTLAPGDLARRPAELEQDGLVALGDLFELSGSPAGVIRFSGDLAQVDRLAAGLTQGSVMVESDLGKETGLALAGGSLDVTGRVGARAGAAASGYKRGMTGGELIVRGSAGPEAGASMRRGLLVIGGAAGERAGLGMIAGNVMVFGAVAPGAGLWSKRGSVVALGKITPPATYTYACTYQPIHLRLMLLRLQTKYGLKVGKKLLSGLYRRYSGDMSELGKGEILEWTAK
jgi:formylmethanofuran dehydrogenase subunit C